MTDYLEKFRFFWKLFTSVWISKITLSFFGGKFDYSALFQTSEIS